MTPETLLTFLTLEVETEFQAGLRRPYSQLKPTKHNIVRWVHVVNYLS